MASTVLRHCFLMYALRSHWAHQHQKHTSHINTDSVSSRLLASLTDYTKDYRLIALQRPQPINSNVTPWQLVVSRSQHGMHVHGKQ